MAMVMVTPAAVVSASRHVTFIGLFVLHCRRFYADGYIQGIIPKLPRSNGTVVWQCFEGQDANG
jgi:hypothetical protein